MTTKEKLEMYADALLVAHNTLKTVHTALMGTRFEHEYGPGLSVMEVVHGRGECLEGVLFEAMKRTNDALWGAGSVPVSDRTQSEGDH